MRGENDMRLVGTGWRPRPPAALLLATGLVLASSRCAGGVHRASDCCAFLVSSRTAREILLSRDESAMEDEDMASAMRSCAARSFFSIDAREWINSCHLQASVAVKGILSESWALFSPS